MAIDTTTAKTTESIARPTTRTNIVAIKLIKLSMRYFPYAQITFTANRPSVSDFIISIDLTMPQSLESSKGSPT